MASNEQSGMPFEKSITMKSRGAICELNELDGVFYSPMTTEAHYKQMADVPVRDEDIWLATYPKSGTHWTWEIINMIKQQSAEISKQSFNILEIPLPPGVLGMLDGQPSPRTMVSHLTVDKVPKQLLTSEAKVIYVFRNPKDVCLSLYHQMVNSSDLLPRGPFAGDLSDWLHIQTSNPDTQMYRGQVDHVYGWLEKAKEMPDKILPVMFEDMKKDPMTAVEKIADFLGFPLSPELMAAIAEKTQFDNMKTVKLGGDLEGFLEGAQYQEMFYRKGQVGGWKSEFTVAQNEAMDAFLNANPHYESLSFAYTL